MEGDDLNEEEDILTTYVRLAPAETRDQFKVGAKDHYMGDFHPLGGTTGLLASSR